MLILAKNNNKREGRQAGRQARPGQRQCAVRSAAKGEKSQENMHWNTRVSEFPFR